MVLKTKFCLKIVEEGDFIYVGEKVDGEVHQIKVMNLKVLLDLSLKKFFPKD